MARWLNYMMVCGLFLFFSVEVVAQSLSAREVMNRASEVFYKAGGIQAVFTVRQGGGASVSQGEIQLQGQKFVLQLGGMKTWFDGRTQWSYVMENEEVNVSEPTAEELQGLNPYAWLSLYREGGRLSLGAGTAKTYVVTVTPVSSRSQIRQMVITLDKRTYYPVVVKIQHGIRDHDFTEISLLDLKTRQHYADGFFRFDAKKYPHVEVIDLR